MLNKSCTDFQELIDRDLSEIVAVVSPAGNRLYDSYAFTALSLCLQRK